MVGRQLRGCGVTHLDHQSRPVARLWCSSDDERELVRYGCGGARVLRCPDLSDYDAGVSSDDAGDEGLRAEALEGGGGNWDEEAQ